MKWVKRFLYLFCFVGGCIITYHAWTDINDFVWRFLVTWTCAVAALARLIDDFTK